MRQSVLPFAARLGHHQHSPSLRLRRLRSVPGFTAISAIVLLLRGYCNTANERAPVSRGPDVYAAMGSWLVLPVDRPFYRRTTIRTSPFGPRQWPSW